MRRRALPMVRFRRLADGGAGVLMRWCGAWVVAVLLRGVALDVIPDRGRRGEEGVPFEGLGGICFAQLEWLPWRDLFLSAAGHPLSIRRATDSFFFFFFYS